MKTPMKKLLSVTRKYRGSIDIYFTLSASAQYCCSFCNASLNNKEGFISIKPSYLKDWYRRQHYRLCPKCADKLIKDINNCFKKDHSKEYSLLQKKSILRGLK